MLLSGIDSGTDSPLTSWPTTIVPFEISAFHAHSTPAGTGCDVTFADVIFQYGAFFS